MVSGQIAPPSPLTTHLHILVTEGNEFNADLLERLLGRRGHRVRLATNGRKALSLAGEGDFDLLLLDMHCCRAILARSAAPAPLRKTRRQDKR